MRERGSFKSTRKEETLMKNYTTTLCQSRWAPSPKVRLSREAPDLQAPLARDKVKDPNEDVY